MIRLAFGLVNLGSVVCGWSFISVFKYAQSDLGRIKDFNTIFILLTWGTLNIKKIYSKWKFLMHFKYKTFRFYLQSRQNNVKCLIGLKFRKKTGGKKKPNRNEIYFLLYYIKLMDNAIGNVLSTCQVRWIDGSLFLCFSA